MLVFTNVNDVLGGSARKTIEEAKWYKGNTHTHTLLSDGLYSPEVVAQWYYDNKYNFLVFTDHNNRLASKVVSKQKSALFPNDFIILSGEEVSGPARNATTHTTGMNIERLVPWQYEDEYPYRMIHRQVDETFVAGGIPILNHPNIYSVFKHSDILKIDRLFLFELYNCNPGVMSFEDEDSSILSTEILWDKVLTAGKLFYGVACSEDPFLGTEGDIPGPGWIMVKSEKLTANAIVDAMVKGDFYASNGVMLKDVSFNNGVFKVEVDEELTQKELLHMRVDKKYINNESSANAYLIEFIGPNGVILDASYGITSIFKVTSENSYVRCKITYGTKEMKSWMEGFFAWTQPIFSDNRVQQSFREGYKSYKNSALDNLSKTKQQRYIYQVEELDGVVVDDMQAMLKGEWRNSVSCAPFVGEGYLTSFWLTTGESSARFVAKLPVSGWYEVRLFYSPHETRSINVPVTVYSDGGAKTIKVNQQITQPDRKPSISLGRFLFSSGEAVVVVANNNTDLNISADAVQFLRIAK